MLLSEAFSIKDLASQAAFKVLLIAGFAVIVLTLIALPVGVLGLAGIGYLYFIFRPFLPIINQDPAAIMAPAEGVVTAITTSPKGIHIRLQQRWESRLHIAMPVAGRIEQNLYVDGAYLSEADSAFEAMNARREIIIEANPGVTIELVQWASPSSRLQLSDALEGQMLNQGDVCALCVMAGIVELIIPATSDVDVSIGGFCMAGQTIIGHVR